MSHIGEITQGIILGPAELCAEFEDSGNAAAAKANLDLFLRWNFSSSTGDRATPAVALIVNQSGLDPTEDRVRRSDFGDDPVPRVEGSLIVLAAPKSKHGRMVIRKVLQNSKPRRIFDRPRAGTHPALRIAILVVVTLALAGGGFFGYLKYAGKM
jgi:hypothetical protein